jgi:hypothetical protein
VYDDEYLSWQGMLQADGAEGSGGGPTSAILIMPGYDAFRPEAYLYVIFADTDGDSSEDYYSGEIDWS